MGGCVVYRWLFSSSDSVQRILPGELVQQCERCDVLSPPLRQLLPTWARCQFGGSGREGGLFVPRQHCRTTGTLCRSLMCGQELRSMVPVRSSAVLVQRRG